MTPRKKQVDRAHLLRNASCVGSQLEREYTYNSCV